MKKKLLIIDGSSMLATSYYGNLPPQIMYAKTDEEKEKYYSEILQTSSGVYTNAVYGMLRTLFKMLQKIDITHIAVVFDKSRKTTFRRQITEDYKANRKETPKPLKEQFKIIEDILEKAGIKVLYDDLYEADDFAASLVEKFSKEKDIEIYVLTKDHDYFQLIKENTYLWRIMTSKSNLKDIQDKYKDEYSISHALPDNVFEFDSYLAYKETGVYPEDFTTLLAIQGDPGDGIVGCKGVSSAAIPLINKYNTLDELYKVIESCHSSKEEKALVKYWKENLGVSRSPLKALKEYKENVYLSEKLATMVKNIPIPFEIEDLDYNFIDKESLISSLKEYEMFSLIEEVENI